MGLGNPGPEYALTRHNAGFMLADHLAQEWQLPWTRSGRIRHAAGERHGIPVTLVKPLGYMNRSGATLAALRQEPDFDPAADLLIAVDDVALPLGRFRLRARGRAGGHNGLKSIEGALRSQEYSRLRIGVGPLPPEYPDLADYVLEEFAAEELAALQETIPLMAEAVDAWLADGIETAMNRFNRSPEEM